MSGESTGLNTSTELAKERSREAADRTLLAWIRTSLSLIGFGFGIGKFYDYMRTAGLRELDPIHSTLIFGAGFIGLGILGLFAAVIQHGRLLRRLDHREYTYTPPWPLGMIMAILLLLIGVFGAVAIFL